MEGVGCAALPTRQAPGVQLSSQPTGTMRREGLVLVTLQGTPLSTIPFLYAKLINEEQRRAAGTRTSRMDCCLFMLNTHCSLLGFFLALDTVHLPAAKSVAFSLRVSTAL